MNHFRWPALTLLATLLFPLIITACMRKGADEKNLAFTIRGTLANSKADRIFLSVLARDRFVMQDTASLNSAGEFSFSGSLRQPDIFRLSLNDTSFMMLVVDRPVVEIRADASDLQATLSVEGSEESALLKEWLDRQRRYQGASADLQARFDRARASGMSDSLGILQEEYLSLEADRDAWGRAFIRRHPDSFVATYLVYHMMGEGRDEAFVDSMLAAFNQSGRQGKYVALMNEQRAPSHSLEVGSIAPPIVLPQPEGSPLSLSSLRGRYVLIDFWASWCKPCRQENPAMVKLYEQYRDEGFEILGVSLDESRERWVEAIEADKLPWRHVSDLRGAGSPVVEVYQVQAVPMTVLVDPHGRVAALNLRGDRLAEKLAEVMPAGR